MHSKNKTKENTLYKILYIIDNNYKITQQAPPDGGLSSP